MKIVHFPYFKDNGYAIQKGWIFKRYLDLRHHEAGNNLFWSTDSLYFSNCLGTEVEVFKKFNLRTGYKFEYVTIKFSKVEQLLYEETNE